MAIKQKTRVLPNLLTRMVMSMKTGAARNTPHAPEATIWKFVSKSVSIAPTNMMTIVSALRSTAVTTSRTPHFSKIVRLPRSRCSFSSAMDELL